MIGQKLQSEITPERLVINVIQRDVEESSRKRKDEYSTATKLKSCLMKIVNISKSNNPDLNSVLIRIVNPARKLLEEYVRNIKSIIARIEETKQKSQLEQLKLVGKIDSVLKLVDAAVKFIESISDYPHKASSKEDLDNIKKSFEELGDLPDKISGVLKKEYRGVRREARSDLRLAKGKRPFKHMKLFLVPKVRDEERRAAEQRVYFIDEKGLEDHLTLLMERFGEERDKIIETITRIANENMGEGTRLNDIVSAHWQPLPINQLKNFPFNKIKYSEEFRGLLTEHFTSLSRLIYAFVYDVKNLLDLYYNHSRSTVNLNIDLSIEEADKLRELRTIIDLIGQFPKKLEVLDPIKAAVKELEELINKIEVFATYDYKRDDYIKRAAIAEYVKSKSRKNRKGKEVGLRKRKDLEYKTGFKGKTYSFRFTVQGVRGRIRGDIFLKDPKKIPRKALIFVPGFTTYRELHDNVISFFAEDGYLSVIFDLSSQGESRGGYGYGEGSENALRVARYIKQQYGVERIMVLGHSAGAAVSLMSLMHYDLEVDAVVRKLREKSAKFWGELSLKPSNYARIAKNVGDAAKSWLESWKKESEIEIKEAILKSYSKWGDIVNCIGILNPLLEEVPSLIRLPKLKGIHAPKFLLYSFLKSEMGTSLFKEFVGKTKSFEDNKNTPYKDAFERFLKMKEPGGIMQRAKKRMEAENNPAKFKALEAEWNELKEKWPEMVEEYDRIKNLRPIFAKGLAVFDKDLFFREIAYAITPLNYFHLIKRFYPEVIKNIQSAPKLAVISKNDTMFKFSRAKKLINAYNKQFKNITPVYLSGVGHALIYPGELLYKGVPFNTAFLNHVHHFLRYNL